MATASWTTERTAFDTRPSIPGSRRVGAAHARRQSQPDGRHSAPRAPPSRIGRSGGGLTGRRQRPRLNRRWCTPNSCSPRLVSRSTPAPTRRPRLRHPPRGTRQEPTVRALRFSAPTAHAVGRPRPARRRRRATAPARQAEGEGHPRDHGRVRGARRQQEERDSVSPSPSPDTDVAHHKGRSLQRSGVRSTSEVPGLTGRGLIEHIGASPAVRCPRSQRWARPAHQLLPQGGASYDRGRPAGTLAP